MVNDYTAEATLHSIEDSLERLRTDRLDIVWVHDVAQDFYGDDPRALPHCTRHSPLKPTDRRAGFHVPESCSGRAAALVTGASGRYAILVGLDDAVRPSKRAPTTLMPMVVSLTAALNETGSGWV
ncbi:hypothetical protein GCM10010207_64140 [Streptomyces atratus]|nr:hypothetical protein GCM10010207_64140 [Streptomyces atratus]